MGGVIAGIAGVAIVLGLGFYIGRKRRARQNAPAAELAEEYKPPPVYRSTTDRSTTDEASETGVYEAPVSKPRQELPDTPRHKQSNFVELPVSSRD